MQEITVVKPPVPEGVTLSGVAKAMKLCTDSSPEKSDSGCRRCTAISQSLRQKDGVKLITYALLGFFSVHYSELNGNRLALFVCIKNFRGNLNVGFVY